MVDEALAELLRDEIFGGNVADYETWAASPPDAARLIWEARTERLKLSGVAESFFRRLAQKVGGVMLLTKGELHRLIPHAELTPAAATEVREKLDLLRRMLEQASRHGETAGNGADDETES